MACVACSRRGHGSRWAGRGAHWSRLGGRTRVVTFLGWCLPCSCGWWSPRWCRRLGCGRSRVCVWVRSRHLSGGWGACAPRGSSRLCERFGGSLPSGGWCRWRGQASFTWRGWVPSCLRKLRHSSHPRPPGRAFPSCPARTFSRSADALSRGGSRRGSPRVGERCSCGWLAWEGVTFQGVRSVVSVHGCRRLLVFFVFCSRLPGSAPPTSWSARARPQRGGVKQVDRPSHPRPPRTTDTRTPATPSAPSRTAQRTAPPTHPAYPRVTYLAHRTTQQPPHTPAPHTSARSRGPGYPRGAKGPLREPSATTRIAATHTAVTTTSRTHHPGTDAYPRNAPHGLHTTFTTGRSPRDAPRLEPLPPPSRTPTFGTPPRGH